MKTIQIELIWHVIFYAKKEDTHGTLIDEDVTFRAQVIGGWLVRHLFISTTASTNQRTDTMTFVPDKHWTWKCEPITLK